MGWVIDQGHNFSSLCFHRLGTSDGTGEFSDLCRTSEFWILESFLEPALDENQDSMGKGSWKIQLNN